MSIDNIILIGMPSSGKTTIGKQLSHVLGLDFTDTDAIIKLKENRELKEIVNTDGLRRFLDIQEAVLLELDRHKSIIATGGSVIYSDAAMMHLKDMGVVIYLKLEFDEIEERIASGRRFARQKDQSFYDIYLERVPLYERYSDIIIECSGKSVEDITHEIGEAFKGHGKKSV